MLSSSLPWRDAVADSAPEALDWSMSTSPAVRPPSACYRSVASRVTSDVQFVVEGVVVHDENFDTFSGCWFPCSGLGSFGLLIRTSNTLRADFLSFMDSGRGGVVPYIHILEMEFVLPLVVSCFSSLPVWVVVVVTVAVAGWVFLVLAVRSPPFPLDAGTHVAARVVSRSSLEKSPVSMLFLLAFPL